MPFWLHKKRWVLIFNALPGKQKSLLMFIIAGCLISISIVLFYMPYRIAYYSYIKSNAESNNLQQLVDSAAYTLKNINASSKKAYAQVCSLKKKFNDSKTVEKQLLASMKKCELSCKDVHHSRPIKSLFYQHTKLLFKATGTFEAVLAFVQALQHCKGVVQLEKFVLQPTAKQRIKMQMCVNIISCNGV